jgi:hypothetical protein
MAESWIQLSVYAYCDRYDVVPSGKSTPIPHHFAAELGILSVGINSSVFTAFLLGVFSQYYLRKCVDSHLFLKSVLTFIIADSALPGSESTSGLPSVVPAPFSDSDDRSTVSCSALRWTVELR